MRTRFSPKPRSTAPIGRYRLYLAGLGLLALLLIAPFLRSLWARADPGAGAQGDPGTGGAAPVEEKAYPFVWSREVHAGERVSADMLRPCEEGKDLRPLGELDALLLELCGRYLSCGARAGTPLSAGQLQAEPPLAAGRACFPQWIGLGEEGPALMENFRAGGWLCVYLRRAAAEGDAAAEPEAAPLLVLRILAVDRSQRRLCLETDMAAALRLARLQGGADLLYLAAPERPPLETAASTSADAARETAASTRPPAAEGGAQTDAPAGTKAPAMPTPAPSSGGAEAGTEKGTEGGTSESAESGAAESVESGAAESAESGAAESVESGTSESAGSGAADEGSP